MTNLEGMLINVNETIYYLKEHSGHTAEEIEQTLEIIAQFKELEVELRQMLQHEISKGYESEKFELIERTKLEFADPVEAEEFLYKNYKDAIYIRKMKPVKELIEGLEFVPELKETKTQHIRKIPTSEKALKKRAEYEKSNKKK